MLRFKAILLLIIFSLSMTANALQIHYCHGKITDISLLSEAICEEDMEEAVGNNSCCHGDLCVAEDEQTLSSSEGDFDQLEKEDCCRSERMEINTLSDKTDRNLETQVAIALAVFFPHLLFQPEGEITGFSPYESPDVVVDIPVLFQSFLI